MEEYVINKVIEIFTVSYYNHAWSFCVWLSCCIQQVKPRSKMIITTNASSCAESVRRPLLCHVEPLKCLKYLVFLSEYNSGGITSISFCCSADRLLYTRDINIGPVLYMTVKYGLPNHLLLLDRVSVTSLKNGLLFDANITSFEKPKGCVWGSIRFLCKIL